MESGNAQDMKLRNRLQVLRLLGTCGSVSRGKIAEALGLTKMTVTNMVGELMDQGVAIEEKGTPVQGAGRRPGLISLSPESQIVGGIYLGRRHGAVLLADLSGRILARDTVEYPHPINGDGLAACVVESFQRIRKDCPRRIAGVGISAPGPLNARKGLLINPPNFYGIQQFPIRDLLSRKLGLPCVLLHDVSAAALAEKLYGAGRELQNFLYLQLADGIGVGIVANDFLFDGDAGLSGELGHMSINIQGPECECGNRGCLELYANEETVLADVRRSAGNSVNLPDTWAEAIQFAENGNPHCIAALDHYCTYLSAALRSLIGLLDIHRVFVGREGEDSGYIEGILKQKLNGSLGISSCRKIQVERSPFQSTAPVLGSAALAAESIFAGELPFIALME